MPKKKRPEEKPEEQFKRFAETARGLETDKKNAEDTFKNLAQQKSASSQKSEVAVRRKPR